MLGLPPAEAIDKLSEAVENGSVASVLATLESMREQGVNPAVVARQLAKGLRSKALAGLDASWLPALLKELIAVPASAEPADYLEICLLEAASQNNARGALNSATVSKSHSELSAQDATATKPISAVNRPRKAGSNFDLKDWDRIVNRTKSEAATLYSALRLAKPELSGSTLKLFFEFPLHQKKLTQAANADLLGKLIEETTGVKLKIETLVDKSKLQPKVPTQVDPKAAEQPTGDPLNDISNIFGGAEVLES
jgi:DNA polymerase III gamma/tau subunit